jgi:hypothetical protein
MRLVGTDGDGCPVIYSSFAQARNKDPALATAHMVATFERTAQLLFVNHPDGGVSHSPTGSSSSTPRFVWVVDFHGFGVADCKPSAGLQANELFSKHYPERLKRMVLVRPPFLFRGLLAMLRAVVAAETAAKIATVAADRAALAAEVGDECAVWILAEMDENRGGALERGKLFFLPRDHEAQWGGDGGRAPKKNVGDGTDGGQDSISLSTVDDPLPTTEPSSFTHDPRATASMLDAHIPAFAAELARNVEALAAMKMEKP